ncbi:RING-box protein 1-like [Teleopsis dalmanni]|uniref:RING-box protein 1-like n=1 Tax=Teleopsis dalmanni TaxID=139649 RepID=UPI0018CE7AA5|nr:RING-box protein 1-like [Teleopsis dalmanni]
MDKEVPSTSKASCPEKRLEITKWDAMATWTWDIAVDNCAICRNNIMKHCIECQASQRQEPNGECSSALGVCNHVFHFHCISRWLKTRNVCPLDNTPWDYQSMGS